MPVTTPAKPAVELALAEEFDRIATKLPGGRAIGAVRREAMARVREQGLPHRRLEAWKYTDLRSLTREPLALAVVDDTNVSLKDLMAALGPLATLDVTRVTLVNGQYRGELSKIDVVDRIDIRPLANALKVMPDDAASRVLKALGPSDDTTTALNTALATDGVMLSIGATPKKPILIVHAEAGNVARQQAVRHTVGVLEGCSVTLIEAYVSIAGAARGRINAATEIAIGDRAHVTHIRVVRETAQHLGSVGPTLGAECSYRQFAYTDGVELGRLQTFPLFTGEDAKLDLSGVMLGRGREHCDMTFVIDHAVPGCESRELIRAVLDDRARGVCQGKVIVRPIAQKTDGKQMAQALMLAEGAEFDSKPELEIYADDVACGHGSTVAEIDPDQLFYLRSRGIPKPEARALLIESFIGEAIEKVEDEAIRAALLEMARSWMAKA